MLIPHVKPGHHIALYFSTQNISVNHLAPTQCPHLAHFVLQILEPSCTQLLYSVCNLTTMMSLPEPPSGAIFSVNPVCLARHYLKPIKLADPGIFVGVA